MAKPLQYQWEILQYVRQHGLCVRSKIARHLGLNASVASELVRQLLERDVLIRGGLEASGGGRPRERVQINPDAVVAIGVHIAMRRIHCVLVNAGGEILAEQSPEGYAAEMSPEATLDAIAALVNQLRDRAKGMRLMGVGIGVSGLVREGGRVTREFPTGARWSEVPLADTISKRCNVRASVINDAHAYALAEQRFGGWGGVQNLVLLHLGDGIAAGFVFDGKLYRGFTGNAGQIGHNIVTEDGSLCYCGNRGCLESVAAPRAMIAACRDAAECGVQTRVVEKAGGVENIMFQHIAAAAALGDPFASNLLDQAGQYIGRAAAALINTFEPPLLLLSGPLAAQSEELVETIRAWAVRRILPALRETTKIECGRLEDNAAALGAAEMVLDDFFMDPNRVAKDLLGSRRMV